jgi:hypothetical protein
MAKKIYVRNNDNTEWIPLATSIPNASAYATYEYVDNELANIDLTSTINTASAAAVTYLVDYAPETLNTLNELSAALNDDANFASTITTSLGNKLDISSASSTYLTQVNASTIYAPIVPAVQTGFRNAIINGDFKINQRGVTTSTTTGYVFDRWYWQGNATTATWSRQPFTPGNQIVGNEGTAFSRTVTNASIATDQLVNMEQRIEDVRTFAGQTVTLSFWAKAASGTPKIAITQGQNFGTGGSPSTGSTTHISQITLSTSWNRYSVTYTVPSISGKTIGTTENTSYYSLYLIYAAGSFFNSITGSLGWQQNTFDIWGVQLEKGSSATPFEQRPIGAELSLCQRYFCSSFPIGIAPANNLGVSATTSGNVLTNYSTTVSNSYSTFKQFPVPMRFSPTMTIYSPTNSPGTWETYNSSNFLANSVPVVEKNTVGFLIYFSGPTVTVTNGAWAADAEL